MFELGFEDGVCLAFMTGKDDKWRTLSADDHSIVLTKSLQRIRHRRIVFF